MKFIKTVYSLLYPETKKLTKELWRENPHFLYEDSYLQPEYQTDIESKFKNAWLNWSKNQITFDETLFYFYNTAGSSEAIRESLASLKASGIDTIYTFSGDYEGYRSLAESYNLKVVSILRDEWKNIVPNSLKGAFYFSNPSSIDGNVWEDAQDFISKMKSENPECLLRVDLCYVGTSSKIINLDLNDVDMIFFSLSKVYGVYFHRIGGVFSKNKMLGLEGNKWFKNLFSLYLGIKLLETYDINYFPTQYRSTQVSSVNLINKENSLDFIPSDVVILAYSENQVLGYSRDPLTSSRICLTPIMSQTINKRPHCGECGSRKLRYKNIKGTFHPYLDKEAVELKEDMYVLTCSDCGNYGLFSGEISILDKKLKKSHDET